jgi:hypothetical protein
VYSSDQIIEQAFQYYRGTGFPYPEIPLHIGMQQLKRLSQMKTYDKIVMTNLCYRIPDAYHKHRLAVPIQRGKKEQPTPVTIFEDDALLRRALMKELKLSGRITSGYFPMLAFINGSQGASNFRPGYAMSLYRRFCTGDAVILDPCAGFGGRVLGALASGVARRYIGFDPSKATHDGNTRMMADLGFPNFARFHCLPIEDGTEKHVKPGTCHFAMTSPPYWSKEHYSRDAGQSWVRYPELDQWERGFLQPFFAFTHQCLRAGGFFAVCIANVLILGKNRPLVEMAIQSARRAGFAHFDTEYYPIPLNESGFTGHKSRKSDTNGTYTTSLARPEKVLFFRKPVPGETAADVEKVREWFQEQRQTTQSAPIQDGFLF